MRILTSPVFSRVGEAARLFAIAAVLSLVLAPLGASAQVTPGAPTQTATISGTVQTNAGAFIAGAHVKLIGPSVADTVTDAYGTFTFAGVQFGRYTILVTAANFGTATKDNIAVNTDTAVTVKFLAPEGLRTIAQVTTSARTAINATPASITTISPSDYAFQGRTSWHNLLENIPGVGVGGGVIQGDSPSLYVSSSPFFPTIPTINGAQPYESATLLDGMPLYLNSNGFSSVGFGSDLSSLPMNSFDAADIIRGPGADSPSIVDSIGGTFELHAPGQLSQNHFEFAVSDDAYGGNVTNSKLDLHVGKLSAHFTFGMSQSPGPEHGNMIPARGFDVFTSVNGKPVNCPGGFFAECIGYLNDGYDFGDDTFLGYPLAFDHFQEPMVVCCFQVSSGWNAHNGSVGLSYQVSPAITAYVYWAGSNNWASQPAPYWDVDFEPGSLGTGGANLYTGSIAPGDHYFVGAEYQNEAHSAVSMWEEKLNINLGEQGNLKFSALEAYSAYKQILNEPGNGQYTLWGTACLGASASTCTPTAFNGTTATLFDPYAAFGSGIYHQWTNNRDLSFDWERQVGSNSNLGVSYVTSYYNTPQANGYTGTSIYNSGYPGSISNTTDETRVHFGSVISQKFNFDVSEYLAFTNYHVPNPNVPGQNLLAPSAWTDSAQSYNAPRLGLVWRASPDIAIRGSAGGGFAIAPIADLVGSNGPPNCFAGTCQQTATNLGLQPEKSFGWDIGTDLRFAHSTVASVDIYRNDLFGQIFNSAQFAGLYQGNFLYLSEYRNLNKSIMEGINFDIRHDVPHGVYWHAAVGLTRGFIPPGSLPANFYNVPGGVCSPSTLTECVNQNVIPGINTVGDFSGVARVPYSNGNIQIGYRWTPRKFIELNPTFVGQNNPYFVPGFMAIDAHAGYPLTKQVTLYATFQNITGMHDELYAVNSPSTIEGLPTLTGLPTQEGLPAAYKPRTFLLTLNFSQ